MRTLPLFVLPLLLPTPPTSAANRLIDSDDERPRVLIIGDSISIGYTPHVRQLLKNEAVVVHNKGNAQHTGTGLKKLDQWVGEGDWDVIHFNWGLWDLCYRHPESKNQGRRDKVNGTITTAVSQYEANLDQLVGRLRRTGAALIWAHTTAVPEGEAGRVIGDDRVYNAAAARVMARHGVRINDLNALTRTFDPTAFVKPGDVHYTKAGYEKIAQQVAGQIRDALGNPSNGRTPSLAEIMSQVKPTKQSVSRLLFGSCIKQDRPIPIFDAINGHEPDVFVFLGDNIYADTEDMTVMRAKYSRLAGNPGLQTLVGQTRVFATWDDHDYGVNDGGRDYPRREESEQVFLKFWGVPADSPRRSRPGIYDATILGPPGRRLQLILLDTRYFRSPLKKGERRVGGSWQPDDDPAKTMLGAAQWKWLEEQLRRPAEIRVIASGIQFLADSAGQETWSNLPRERARLLQLVEHTKAAGVLFISGDRHWAELSRLSDGVPYPIYDLTSSSFNQIHARGTPTANALRAVPTTWHRENFGVLLIDWTDRDPRVTLQIRDLEDRVRLEKQLHLSELQP